MSDVPSNTTRTYVHKASVVDAEEYEEDAGSTESYTSSSNNSDGDSSDAVATPSSRSTFPSPTTTRGSSKSAHRQRRGSHASSTSDRQSATSSERSIYDREHRTSSAADAYDDHDNRAQANLSELHALHYEQRLRSQEEVYHQHVQASRGHTPQPPGYYHAAYDNPADRHYRHVQAQKVIQGPDDHHEHVSQTHHSSVNVQHAAMEPAPDAPDFTKTTMTGYEQVAMKLSDPSSTIRPIYRKFEHLNHRVLLYLQDEISDLEDQLRRLDECIAQITPTVEPEDSAIVAAAATVATAGNSKPAPASRRWDYYAGSEIHHRRRDLLGWIFQKTEQYNRALSAYAALEKEFDPPKSENVSAYKDFLEDEKPIHAPETRFLDHSDDLIAFPRGGVGGGVRCAPSFSSSSSSSSSHSFSFASPLGSPTTWKAVAGTIFVIPVVFIMLLITAWLFKHIL